SFGNVGAQSHASKHCKQADAPADVARSGQHGERLLNVERRALGLTLRETRFTDDAEGIAYKEDVTGLADHVEVLIAERHRPCEIATRVSDPRQTAKRIRDT